MSKDSQSRSLFFSFDPLVKKRSTAKGGKDEVAKLLHKMKREKKGAKKEIRQDAAFIAKRKAEVDRERQGGQICLLGVARLLFD